MTAAAPQGVLKLVADLELFAKSPPADVERIWLDDRELCGRLAISLRTLLAAAPQWISVAERLPEAGEFVLVTNHDGAVDIAARHPPGAYEHGPDTWRAYGDVIVDMVPTHWMPLWALPEPPKT